jgi:hypothetical protein
MLEVIAKFGARQENCVNAILGRLLRGAANQLASFAAFSAKCRIASGLLFGPNWPMGCTETLKAHVSPEIKLQARAVAENKFLSEAAWLKRLVLREIRACDVGQRSEAESSRAQGIRRSGREARGLNGCGKPMLVRLTTEDRLLLDARAEARGMRPATYASVILRSHLRMLTPIPKDEYLALKRSIALLASIGRNINQIAKAANGAGRVSDSAGAEFRAMLKICVALRDNTKALLKANETSWRTGHAQADL